MKLHLFNTKLASLPFLNAFSKNHDVKVYNSKENESAKGKGADRFLDYSWPSWDGTLVKEEPVIFQGLVRGTKEVHDVAVSEGVDWYYFDQPYFFMKDYRQSDTGDRWYRICKNNTQKNFLEKSYRKIDKRFDDLITRLPQNCRDELTPKPWQYDGKHILIIPPSYHTACWYGIDSMEWTENVIKTIAKYDRKHPVKVRQKFKNGVNWGEKLDRPLSEDLKDCFVMVSFHSMCAVQAVMNGIPSYCSEHSPAYPVSLGLDKLSEINDPLYAADREHWVKGLMCAQFTEEEMKSGQAWGHLNGENVW